jgi:hypothetical protein
MGEARCSLLSVGQMWCCSEGSSYLSESTGGQLKTIAGSAYLFSLGDDESGVFLNMKSTNLDIRSYQTRIL